MFQWSKNTYKTYELVVKNYTNFQQVSFTYLITEAEAEEELIHKISKRSIKKRLIRYQLHLQQENRTPNTIRNYMSKILKVYKYLDIETPALPPVKNYIIETYEDLPTKQEINEAIFYSRLKMKALITFLASSGLRRSDAANLKVGDFFKATKDQHKAHDVLELITQLQKQELVIPEWHITSKKTNISHITFSSHESSMYILQMLKERLLIKEVVLSDSLFEVSAQGITKNFNKINSKLGLGWKQTRRKFHPHSLRKYFATTLTNNDVDFLTTEFLMGHTLPSVQQSYYYANPERLKRKYVRVMKELTFTMTVNYLDVSSKEKRELEQLRSFKTESEQRILQLEEMVNLIQNSFR